MNRPNIGLHQTCGACPEAYDVFFNEEYAGYLRLRHGIFRAYYGEEVVYSSTPKGDGIFEPEERDQEINSALKAMLVRWEEENKTEENEEPLIPYRLTYE